MHLLIKNIFIVALFGISIITSPSLYSHEKREAFDVEPSEVIVIRSVIDTKTINEIVHRQYAFNKSIKSSLLSTGVNDMYLVEVGNEKYVLRLSRVDKYLTMTKPEFQFELDWLDFLKQKQIPVAYPICRNDDSFFGLILAPEGPRYVTLFSFAEGNIDLNNEQASILGQTLAQLHLVSENFVTSSNRIHLNINNLIDQPIQQIKNHLSDEQKIEFLDKLALELKEQIGELEISKDTYGIIAGDVHGYNQHFTKNNELTMFDFEYCAYGYRIYDIATFRWGRGSDNEELWQHFLAGYQSVRQLTNSEIHLIDTFVKARNLWWIGSLLSLPEYKSKLDEEFWNEAFSSLSFNSHQ